MTGDAATVEALPGVSRRRVRLAPAFTRTVEGRIGLVLLVAIVFVIVVGPALAPYPPTQTGTGPPGAGPSAAHLLGTDLLGRDVLSRVLSGGRSVIVIPLIAVSIAVVGGTVLGMALGLAGGRIDSAAARVLDLLLGIPPLLAVLVIAAAFGTGAAVLVIAIAVVFLPRTARVVRGAAQRLRNEDYVVAARLRGEPPGALLRREVLPNMMPTLTVEAATRLTFAIVFVASLNFLGLGAQPPDPNWGLMVSEARNALYQAPLTMIAPATAIAVLCVGVSLLADALGRVVRDDDA